MAAFDRLDLETEREIGVCREPTEGHSRRRGWAMRFAAFTGVVGLTVSGIVDVPRPDSDPVVAEAATNPNGPVNVDNGALADKALVYADTKYNPTLEGKKACEDAHASTINGQCKQFVNCVLNMVMSKSPSGYQQGFYDAGAVEITSRSSAVKGDIIQVTPAGSTDANAGTLFDQGKGKLHTMIIVDGAGDQQDSTFTVVDSNWDNNEKTRVHSFDMNAAGWSSSIERIWRFGKIDGSGAAPVMPNNTGANDPKGKITGIIDVPGGVILTGYQDDVDTSSGQILETHIYGGNGAAVPENASAPTITNKVTPSGASSQIPWIRPNRGWEAFVPVGPQSQHHFAAYGINVGAGKTSVYGVADYRRNSDGTGIVEQIIPAPGGWRIIGRASDIDTSASTAITVSVGAPGSNPDTRPSILIPADKFRQDVYDYTRGRDPGYRGFDAFVGTPAGSSEITVTAMNKPGTPGANVEIFKRTYARSGDTRGNLEAVNSIGGGKVEVTAWGLDGDNDQPIYIDVFGGNGQPLWGVNPADSFLATDPRADVSTANPGYSANHGITKRVLQLSPGAQTVCAYFQNSAGTPGNSFSMCRAVSVG